MSNQGPLINFFPVLSTTMDYWADPSPRGAWDTVESSAKSRKKISCKHVWFWYLTFYFYLKKKRKLTPFFRTAYIFCVEVELSISTCSSWGDAVVSLETVSSNLVMWWGGFLREAHATRHASSTSKYSRRSKNVFFMSGDRIQLMSPFPKSLFVYFCLICFFAKVILMGNIKNELHHACIPFPRMVSTDVWPLPWLDRLICFLGAAWKYPDLWLVWCAGLLSTMVSMLWTRRSRPPDAATRGPGWHGEADGRVSRDCLQMLFRGPSAYLTRGCGT